MSLVLPGKVDVMASFLKLLETRKEYDLKST